MEEKQRSSRQQFILRVPLLVVALVAVLFIPHSVDAAWSEPTADPPGGNVAAPINVSSINQVKRGGLAIQGGLSVGTLPGNSWAISGVSPDAASGQITSGVFGQGSNTAGGLSAGVYGLSYGVANAGTQVGLLGAAGANSFTSIGVYGTNNAFQNAYAGYFRGTTLVEGSFRVGVNPDTGSGGDISATRFCIGTDCITSWPSGGGGGGESLFTESPPNNTYLNNTGSDLALGGTDSANGAFYFNVSGAGRGSLFAEQSITIGEPSTAINGNHFCETGELCTASYDDCWAQQANCGAGNYCNAGACQPLDAAPPQLVGSISIVTTTTSAAISFQTNEESTSNLNYKQGSADPDSGGIPIPVPADTSADQTQHSLNITGLTSGTIYSYKLHLKDAAGNEFVSTNATFTTDIPIPSDTTPPSVPANLSINGTVGTNTIPIRWDISTDTGGSGLAGYRIHRCSGSGSCTPTFYFDTGTVANSFTDTGLTTGTIYRYEVSAYDNNNNESGKSNRITVTTATGTGGGSGGSPAILKGSPGTGPGGTGSAGSLIENLATNIYQKVESPLVEAIKPLSRLLGISQAKAKIGFFDIPSASAAAPFGGNSSVRLSINNGVLQINNGGAVMEIGNEAGHTVPGHDIASTGALYIRPNNSTAASYFEGSGSTQNLVLTGYLRVGNTSNTTNGNIRYTGTDIEGYVNGTWKSLTSGGGGGSIDPTNYIWNSNNPPGGNSPGGTQGNASINIGLGANIGGDLVAGNTTLTVLSAGRVGIGLIPNANYKLDVAGNINTTGAYFRNGVTGVTSAPCNGDGIVVGDITVSGGIVTAVTCEPDDGGSGGGIGGSGTTNTIPRFTAPNIIGDSVITQVSGNIGINRGTPSQRLDVGGSAHIRGDLEVDSNDDGVRELTVSINGSVPNLIVGPYVSSQAGIVSNNASIWARDVNGDIVIGGTNFANGQVPGVPELCFTNSCIDAWSDLILNTDQFGNTPQPGGFNVAGNGQVGNTFTVVNGPLVLPTSGAALSNRIEKDGGTLAGHKISSKIVFGGNVASQIPNDPNAFGIGFVEDDDLSNPIVVVKENREVHLGYYNAGNDRAATRLCLYGSGSADCRNIWPDGGASIDSSQYIWNSNNPPGGNPPGGTQANAALNIGLGANIGGELVAGGTLTVQTSGNVGVNTAGPSTNLEVVGKAIIGADAVLTGTETLKISGGTSQNTWINIAGSKNGTTSENLRGVFGIDGTGASNEDVYLGADTPGTDLFLYSTSANIRLDSAGNVGVGYASTTPPTKFAVAGGNLRIDGAYDLLVGGTKTNGNVGGTPEICLNDDCISSWPSGGGSIDESQYIWNSQNPPGGNTPGGVQGSASVKVGGEGFFGNQLVGGGGTLTATTTSVGVGIIPSGTYKFEVLGSSQLGDLKLTGTIKGNDARESLKIQTLDGNIVIGPQNGSYAHILTDVGKFYFNKDIYSDGAFSSYSNDNLVFQTGGTTRMTVLGNADANAGYVGIGTTTPTAQLHVALDANEHVIFGTNGQSSSADFTNFRIASNSSLARLQGLTLAGSSLPVTLEYGTTEVLRIHSNQSVGINQSAPNAKLTVNNNFADSGNNLDTIGAYGNNGNGSTIYAEQGSTTGYAGYFSGVTTNTLLQPAINGKAVVRVVNNASTETSVGILAAAGSTSTTSRGSYGIMGFGQNVVGVNSRSVGVWGQSDGTYGSSGNAFRAGVVGSTAASNNTAGISAGLYGINPGPGGDGVNYAIYAVGDIGDIGNKWGTHPGSGSGSVFTETAVCSQSDGSASVGCQCPDGTFMVGYKGVNGTNNDFSISCRRL